MIKSDGLSVKSTDEKNALIFSLYEKLRWEVKKVAPSYKDEEDYSRGETPRFNLLYNTSRHRGSLDNLWIYDGQNKYNIIYRQESLTNPEEEDGFYVQRGLKYFFIVCENESARNFLFKFKCVLDEMKNN